MKTLIGILFASLAFGQSTTFYSWNLQASPTDSALPIAVTLDSAVALANVALRTAISGSASSTKLTGACALAATSCTVADITGITPGNGLCFSSPCTASATATGGPPPTTFTYSGGEIALITAVTPGSGTTGILTLKRNSMGTTAVNANSGQAVSVTVAGSFTQFTANLIAAASASIIQNCSNGAYTTVTNCAAINTATAAIAGAK